MSFQIREITSEETRPLRHKILRPNQDYSQTKYSPDDEQDSFHVGAFQAETQIGTASLHREDRDVKGGWRLRGMAVEEAARKLGVGRALLEACLSHAKKMEAKYFWFNARTPAVGFYERLGFVREGEEFEVAEIGPHYVMRLWF